MKKNQNTPKTNHEKSIVAEYPTNPMMLSSLNARPAEAQEVPHRLQSGVVAGGAF